MSFSTICPECGHKLEFHSNFTEISELLLREIIEECHIVNTYDSFSKFYKNFQIFICVDILNNIKCENKGFIKVQQE
jgi:hypothetical protein